jgi:UDP-3-O-[3-hydroxymyristoyl] glucosamine N-acyltransferase
LAQDRPVRRRSLGKRRRTPGQHCIDRGSIGETRIGRDAKIDSLVHVGHSCTIGRDTLLRAQVGLAGTTDVGNNVISPEKSASAAP